MAPQPKAYTREEVAQHNKDDDAWIIVDSKVYNVTRFAGLHPGGEKELLQYAGKDATDVFFELHRTDVLDKFGARLQIGYIKDEEPELALRDRKEISAVPFSESSFFRGFKSPYYTESHTKFREAIREFVAKEIVEEAEEGEKSGTPPTNAMYQKMGRAGILAARLGPGEHLKIVGLPAGVKPEEFDYFHEMIAHEELARVGFPSYSDGLGAGYFIGLSPVINFGTKKMLDTVVPETVLGKKQICLAISEPYAGSDVANIRCTARKTPDGKHYIVNGVKKWITNGTFSHYFVTAVRTGGDGMGGISLLLVERSEGLTTKPIKTLYGGAAGTSLVIYEDVKVPVENLLGRENEGFQCIMANFNHERWMICALILAGCRGVIEECFLWANQRKVFGKRLIDQPSIREKMAYMCAESEALQNWMENITYQMNNMDYMEQTLKLPSSISLLKLRCSRFMHFVGDQAAQIFGGRAITSTGMGAFVERFIRSIKYGAILGGSEEIMGDLGIKMAMKEFPLNARL